MRTLLILLMLCGTAYADMKYYLVDNEYLYKTEKDGELIGWGVDQPKEIKKYPYYKLCFKADGSQCVIQSEENMPLVKLTLVEAQALSDKWVKDYAPVEKDGVVVPATSVKVDKYDVKEIKDVMVVK